MKSVKELDICFENCESITIPKQFIGELLLSSFKTEIAGGKWNSIQKYTVCKNVAFSVCRNFLDTSGLFGNAKTPIERFMQYDDITHISVRYEDDEVESFSVTWDESDQMSNSYQKTTTNVFGDCFIVISKKKKMEDVFLSDEINSDEYRTLISKR